MSLAYTTRQVYSYARGVDSALEDVNTMDLRTRMELLSDAAKLARLEDAPPGVDATDGQVSLRFDLPRQAVSLLVLSW